MIKLNSLRINIVTKGALYGEEIQFFKGLNVIRGNNSSGKSTVFQGLLYGLGMEEIIGGKNTMALQYVLKDKIKVDEKQLPVIESSILLEIENQKGESITIQRYIESDTYDPRYVKVYLGKIISETPKPDIESLEMYLHDQNAAKNLKYGFHAYLNTFLNTDLPDVSYTDGSSKKLYLQTIFPSFAIEQKNGWADFLATIPYYKIKDVKSKVIEYILKLDVLENQKNKENLNFEKKIIEYQWEQKYIDLKDILKSENLKVEGLNIKPQILKPEDKIYVRRMTADGYKNLDELLEIFQSELNEIEKESLPKTGQISDKLSKQLDQLTVEYSKLNFSKQNLVNKIVLSEKDLKGYKKEYSETINELENYKAYKKVRKFAKDEDVQITQDLCPTCSQEVKDTLLPQDINQNYMKLDENINHLKSQKDLYLAFIRGQENQIFEHEQRLDRLSDKIRKNRSTIKSLNREMIADDRIPSKFIIEKKVNLESQIRHYQKIKKRIDTELQEFKDISKKYAKTLGRIKELPNAFYSSEDLKKMDFFNNKFKSLLEKFNYRSYEIRDISIPYDNYFPNVKGLNLVKRVDEKKSEGKIKHNSSASDFIRAIWSYTISLFETSYKFNANHPGILLFDEPSQHDMANKDMNSFLNVLASNKDCQSIVFASFGERDDIFKQETKGIQDFHLVDFSRRDKIFQLKSEL
ncbi:hypothetical protein [Autumnicola musiva]|uniref:Rad50/SbcC-type AAA domain-containing protein n=1 Tax=Autumnicola musiva TaxID=3075589 RepID=A0ABU3D6Z4_9FLAO|nr:hypothetical protein [Zunongwangia sp. F117]MDT0677309.1 hypothetical protein [Zunongwangia sp. F117]